ncbi:hypothetical protein [Paenibacillus sp. MMO-58]
MTIQNGVVIAVVIVLDDLIDWINGLRIKAMAGARRLQCKVRLS